MPINSNKATYNGATPPKPKHHFSRNSPTSHPADDASLRNYRLDRYNNGPNSVLLLDIQTRKPGDIQAAHQAQVVAELNVILSRLGPTKGPEVHDAVVEGLFDAYKVREQEISEREVLRTVAVQAGIDGAEVDVWLNSDADADVVDEEEEENKRRFSGLGVPAFIIQDVHRLTSVQDTTDLLEVSRERG
ncbi:hypothetical protein M434DRAFT_35713 [Hypoxylon sp. CO27-5]|nr:hypothetical protein M434DRAFT_35713 [Hypoxylon sp. CO27-5]